ncbi:MAG: hypothetical protein ACI8WB_003211 [Phenylobacterium sp.]|jgi:hypothetical protein
MALNPGLLRLQILGYAIEFVSEENSLLDIVGQLYPLADAESVATTISISLQCSPASPTTLANQVQFTLSSNNLQLTGKNAASRCFADRQTMTGQIQLCREMLKSPYLMRHQWFNTLSYFLLSYQQITPLHCCAFRLNQHTFVCLGDSGAGKSNLAMAAVESGLPLLAEDLAFISGQQLHSDCREIHLLGDSVSRFSWLQQLPFGSSHNGKNKFIVPVSPATRIAKCQKLATVFIKPQYHRQQSVINKNNNELLFQALFEPTEAGFDLCCQPRRQHIRWLSQQPSYIAQVGSDSQQFFQQLRELQP